MDVQLRPVQVADLAMFERFAVEPGLIGLDWAGFRDAQEPARQFAENGFLSPAGGRLMVTHEGIATGFVSWASRLSGGIAPHWEIGIALLPAWRGQGIGWRAQALLCEYLFTHTPAQRIAAATHPENIAEQKALVKAGFRLEGVIRAAEFRAGEWRDGHLYSRLRDDRIT
jgi:RimJ/RimL family protein N-acetyltransferase